MKIKELNLILKQLEENQLDDVNEIEADENWYYIRGTGYQCGIPNEKNTLGKPYVQMTVTRPIKLERA